MTAAAPNPAYRIGRCGVIHVGDAGAILPQLPAASVQLAITSPPYHDHKTYGDAPHPDDIGRPQPYANYLEQMSAVWRQCYRLLAPGGKLVFNSANMKIRGAAQSRLSPFTTTWSELPKPPASLSMTKSSG